MDDPVDRELRDLIAAQRHEAQAQERRHRYWLLRQAEESGTLHGVLADLADLRATVRVDTSVSTVVDAVVVEVGRDFVALVEPGGKRHVLAIAALTAVRRSTRTRPVTGDRPVDASTDLADVLRSVAPDHPEITAVLSDGTSVVGILQSVGGDVARLVADGGEAYVPMRAIVEVTIA